jgi:hypothetical protein
MDGELGTSFICLVTQLKPGRRICQLHNSQPFIVFEFAPLSFHSLLKLPIVVVVVVSGPKSSMIGQAAASDSTAWRSLSSLPSVTPQDISCPAGYFADSKMTSVCLIWLQNAFNLDLII